MKYENGQDKLALREQRSFFNIVTKCATCFAALNEKDDTLCTGQNQEKKKNIVLTYTHFKGIFFDNYFRREFFNVYVQAQILKVKLDWCIVRVNGLNYVLPFDL